MRIKEKEKKENSSTVEKMFIDEISTLAFQRL